MKKLEIGIEVAPSHAFGRTFVEGVARFAARRKEWKLRAIQQNTPTSVLRACDGIIMRAIGERLDNLARTSGIPVVDIACEKGFPHIAQISVDEAACGKMAAEFFLARRHTNFGFCGIPGATYSSTLREAFCDALRGAGFTPEIYAPPERLKDASYDNPYRTPDKVSLRKWINALKKPVALCCSNDNRAYQVMECVLANKFSVPNEVSILGCDNDVMLCTFAPVPLSSIDSDADRLGYSAARLLDALIRRRPSDKPHPPYRIRPKSVVERESTEFFPVEPPWLSEALLLIEKNLSDGVSAQDVFAQSGHSPPHVEKLFREKIGVSVQTHITSLRMKKALALLKDGKMSAKEVAFACGYASPQYFSRAFRGYYGTSPLACGIRADR